MSGIHLTADAVCEYVSEVFDEFGEDFLYESCPVKGCAYVHVATDENGNRAGLIAGCFVGQILVRAGVDLGWLADQATFDPSLRHYALGEGITFTDRAYDTLALAQYFQDQGAHPELGGPERYTWGQAWSRARSITGRIHRYDGNENRL